MYRTAKNILRARTAFDVRSQEELIPTTTLADDVCLNYNTLSKRLLAPLKFTVGDIQTFATAFDMEAKEWFDLFHRKIEEGH
jgi:hypothetical protein